MDLNLSQGSDIKDITTNDFSTDVIAESQNQPVLVDFWAPWCGPCKQLTPVIEKVVREAKGRVKLVKLNIDENPEIPGQMGIQSIPAVVAFKDGQPVDGFMGAVPESEINKFIDKVAGPAGPSQLDTLIEEGEQNLTDEAYEQAAQMFGAVLQSDQTNLAAISGLARAALGLGDAEKARQIMETIPEDQREDDIVKSVFLQLDLIEKASDPSEIEAMHNALEANPDDHETRFNLAIALNAEGKKQEAAAELLEIARRDRNWQEDGARKELLNFFDAWGVKDPATIWARRKLSSLLFS